MIKNILFSFAIIVFISGIAMPAHAALLDGKQIQLDYLYPDTSSVYNGNSYLVTVGPGVEIPGILSGDQIGASVDLSDTNIFIKFLRGEGSFTSSAFNGPHIYDSQGVIDPFTSVTINSVTDLPGFDFSRISFDADNIYINFSGLPLDASTNPVVSIDLNGAPSNGAVPEPATMLLFGIGGIATAFVRRRRKI